MSAIPPCVLGLLRSMWAGADPDYSAFDSVFRDGDRQRLLDPSYYYMRPVRSLNPGLSVWSHAEAAELIKGGAFGALAEVRADGITVINEHAQHALVDFCEEVYASWEKYQRRIAEAEKRCPNLTEREPST